MNIPIIYPTIYISTPSVRPVSCGKVINWYLVPDTYIHQHSSNQHYEPTRYCCCGIILYVLIKHVFCTIIPVQRYHRLQVHRNTNFKSAEIWIHSSTYSSTIARSGLPQTRKLRVLVYTRYEVLHQILYVYTGGIGGVGSTASDGSTAVHHRRVTNNPELWVMALHNKDYEMLNTAR